MDEDSLSHVNRYPLVPHFLRVCLMDNDNNDNNDNNDDDDDDDNYSSNELIPTDEVHCSLALGTK